MPDDIFMRETIHKFSRLQYPIFPYGFHFMLHPIEGLIGL